MVLSVKVTFGRHHHHHHHHHRHHHHHGVLITMIVMAILIKMIYQCSHHLEPSYGYVDEFLDVFKIILCLGSLHLVQSIKVASYKTECLPKGDKVTILLENIVHELNAFSWLPIQHSLRDVNQYFYYFLFSQIITISKKFQISIFECILMVFYLALY